MSKQSKCMTPSCNRDSAHAGLCQRCYNRAYHAMRKGVAWTMKRRSTLQVWGETLDSLSTSNVTHIAKRRKAA